MGTPQETAPTVIKRSPESSAGPMNAQALVAPLLAERVHRYVPQAVLGKGGMGEVDLCADAAVGRDVARKRLQGAWAKSPEAVPRFLREARIQGQLEHPAVVPVYDLAVDEGGAPYFTMKRIRGVTLFDVLAGLKADSPEWERRFSKRRLLAAFSTVCLAADFAHRRGVIHRDIKPGNIMLGEFGEVHLLDWGIAKVVGEIEEASARSEGPTTPAATEAGAIMGTPGYMAPEQALGELTLIGPATDVYALGATLFEILTLEPLHTGSSVQKLNRTLHPVELKGRLPDAAPELAALVERCLAVDIAARLPTARELAEGIEHFLDGDRDLVRRRELADMHLEVARRYSRGAAGGRVVAVREVFKALSLDPQNPEAPLALAALLAKAPDDLPQEARAERAQASQAHAGEAGRLGVVRYLTWAAFAPVVIAMGVMEWPLGLAWVAATVAAVGASFALWKKASLPWNVATLLFSTAALCFTALLMGPFILVPALAATNAMFFAAYGDERVRKLAVPSGLLAVLLPLGAEWLSWVGPAYDFADDAVRVLPRLTHFPSGLTHGVLLASSLALVVTPVLMAARLRRRLDEAESKLFAQAWLLQRLVPEGARQKSAVP